MTDLQHTPCIVLPGIGQSKVELLDGKGEKVKMAWPLDVNGDALLGSLKGSLMKMMLFRRDAGFSDKVAGVVKEAADPIAVNPDGTMKNNVRVVTYPYSLAKCSEDEKRYIYKMVPMQKLTEAIGEENLYFFAFNSFGEPYKTARALDAFIQQVKAETGSDRVNLIPVSLGGALSTAYFDAYGSKNDVKRVLYFVAALEGTHLIADVMEKKINADDPLGLLEMFSDKATVDSLRSLTAMMPEGVLDATMDKLIDTLLDNTICNCGMLWATVPPDRYEALAISRLSDTKHAALRAMTDKYWNAQKNLRAIIAERQKNGTEFFAIVGYNLPLQSFVPSVKLSSDGLINTSSASLGAETKPLGEFFTEQEAAENLYISPDRTVDASKGFLPDTTWYFKDQFHDATAYNDTALEIAKRVLSDDSFKDIFSDASLPQFGVAQDNRK